MSHLFESDDCEPRAAALALGEDFYPFGCIHLLIRSLTDSFRSEAPSLAHAIQWSVPLSPSFVSMERRNRPAAGPVVRP